MQQPPTRVVGRRVVAYLVDALLWALINAGLWLALTNSVPKEGHTGGIVIGSTRHGFTSSTNRTIWFVLLGVTFILIFVILPALRGWSPGKALLGIRLVNREGRPPGILRSFLREILWVVDGLPGLPLVGFVTALASKANQRVGDLAAGTFVVRADAVGRPIAELMSAPAAFPAGGPPLASPAQPPAQPAGPGQPAGWYADPQGQTRLRWWDGANWTDHTSA